MIFFLGDSDTVIKVYNYHQKLYSFESNLVSILYKTLFHRSGETLLCMYKFSSRQVCAAPHPPPPCHLDRDVTMDRRDP